LVDYYGKSLRQASGELLGLPGVGKSWIAQNGSDAIPQNARLLLVPQGWSFGKLVNIANGIWVGRSLVPIIVYLLIANVAAPWHRHLRSTFLIFERLGRQVREKKTNHQIIHDEGILQTLWGLLLHVRVTDNNLRIINKLFRRAAGLIGSVYYVSCPRDMRVSRASFFSKSQNENTNNELLSERECMALVLRQARGLGIKINMVENIRNISWGEGVDMQKPFVSVVVPMRNEAAFIGNCLRSLLNNDYLAELMEILVVDGMSDDGSREIVTEITKTYAGIRLLNNPERITPAALNVGIEEARGDIIVRMDVHAIYPSDYIRSCVEGLLKYGADNIGGVWDIQPGAETNVAKAIALAQSHPVGVGNVAYRLGSKGIKWVDTVPYGCYRKEVLQRLGGFDNDLIRNQDDELNARLREAGGKILLDPSIQCTYFARPTLKQIGRMFYQYGYYKPLASRKIGRAYTIRQLVPPTFVAMIILLSLGAIFSGFMFSLLLILFFIYFLTTTSAAVHAGRGSGTQVVFWLPVVFAIMHFAYGLGALQGIFDFLICDKKPCDVPLTRSK